MLFASDLAQLPIRRKRIQNEIHYRLCALQSQSIASNVDNEEATLWRPNLGRL